MTKTMPMLGMFTGSCTMERWSMLFPDIMTEGMKYLAESVGAYWLLDIVGSYQPKLRRSDFQLWKISVKNNKAVVTMREDTDEKPLVTQKIGYTDFPEGSFEFYACRNARGNVTVMLKGEY